MNIYRSNSLAIGSVNRISINSGKFGRQLAISVFAFSTGVPFLTWTVNFAGPVRPKKLMYPNLNWIINMNLNDAKLTLVIYP
jgi:hypothetical protein